ncbi:hypothetical protein [uncultured Nevskia sp.]|uniref:hypothetical protein n=1 Tax=uncultured Nevskia sp. TaxID=228950 RepID=UPI0025E3B196|nr:hypothetical protein [uncultured Nevskia sp.]
MSFNERAALAMTNPSAGSPSAIAGRASRKPIADSRSARGACLMTTAPIPFMFFHSLLRMRTAFATGQTLRRLPPDRIFEPIKEDVSGPDGIPAADRTFA